MQGTGCGSQPTEDLEFPVEPSLSGAFWMTALTSPNVRPYSVTVISTTQVQHFFHLL